MKKIKLISIIVIICILVGVIWNFTYNYYFEKSINSSYSKFMSNIYYRSNKIEWVDFKSFQILNEKYADISLKTESLSKQLYSWQKSIK